jgi:DnaK suppressor protein
MSLAKNDLESLRTTLQTKRAELLRKFGENVASGSHPEQENYPDTMDAATRAEHENEALGLASEERVLLSEVVRALAKIDGGTYGVSELSQRPIPIERLRALPWARLTADEEEHRARGR